MPMIEFSEGFIFSGVKKPIKTRQPEGLNFQVYVKFIEKWSLRICRNSWKNIIFILESNNTEKLINIFKFETL